MCHLELDADTLVKIFNGVITDWSDPAIAALNPDARPPALPIKVAFRSAESTSTLVFQQYLDRAADWPSGVDTSFTGGTGTGYPTEEDLRSAVGVGYGGIGYAGATDLGSGTEARLGPAAPNLTGVAAAVDTALGDEGFELANDDVHRAQEQNPEAYPLVVVSYAIVCERHPDPASTAAVHDFLMAALTGGTTTNSFQLPTGELAERLRTALSEME
jgi:phosphate transport system substrate-binding protein